MDETRLKILNDSNKIINKLQLLSVFFGEEVIYKIYLRSQIIHKLFESNVEAWVNETTFDDELTCTHMAILRGNLVKFM